MIALCNIHPWMRGYVLLRANPYMAKTDANGRFLIRNLPVGEHRFQFWHERTGYLSKVQIGSRSTDARGRLKLKIKPAMNYLTPAHPPTKMFHHQ